MNEPLALVVYFTAILATIAYTALVGRWVQRQHNRDPMLGCMSLCAVVVPTAFLAFLAFTFIGR